MVNIVFIVILLAVLCGAVAYIVRAKKQGQKCVGCPYSKTCSAQAKAQCSENKEYN